MGLPTKLNMRNLHQINNNQSLSKFIGILYEHRKFKGADVTIREWRKIKDTAELVRCASIAINYGKSLSEFNLTLLESITNG